ncbi:uncharacterized protein V1513DRAFT_121930 [Lipomyces chichibuensis]|uniref:uncharacterized protein n=1 Tax=Lipomyces chichibuensis TaxID=1546026 RepID=UPI0033430EFC
MARIRRLVVGALVLQMPLLMVFVSAMPVVNGDFKDVSNSTVNIEASNTTTNYTNTFQIEAPSPLGTAIINLLAFDATDNSNISYQGKLQVYSANSSTSLNDDSIAYISCDDPSSAVSLAVVQAAEQHPLCILLYSTKSRTCGFARSCPLYNGDLGIVFSTLSASVGNLWLSAIENSPNPLKATVVWNKAKIPVDTQTSASVKIAFAETTLMATETSQMSNIPMTTSPGLTSWTMVSVPSTSSLDTQTSQSSGHTTAVAMIILYSVTGLVSGFFLLVIILGAIRAHRHPERYQVTTNPDGTVQRKNRARVLAKAVLDSIPLVKVPESHHHHQSDDTVERTEDGNNNIKMVELNPATGCAISQNNNETQPKVEQDNGNMVEIGKTDGVRSSAPAEGRISKDCGSNSSTISIPSALMIPTNGCPICFESFSPGQDLRILPCHHGFHASCVDPWLLNSSSQCPLCRVDLNLRAGAEIPDIPPGLMPGGEEGRSDADMAEALDVNGLNTRLNRFLDTWNAQLLPRLERRVALERLRDEGRIQRELRRRREEHLRSETGPSAWRRFVEGRRRLFNLQQQRERGQAQEERSHNSEQVVSSSENVPSSSSSSSPTTSQNDRSFSAL